MSGFVGEPPPRGGGLGPVSKCSVEPRRGPGGDPARRRFVWIPVLYPDETPTRPVVVWARRRPARHFETGPRGGRGRRAGSAARAGCHPRRGRRRTVRGSCV